MRSSIGPAWLFLACAAQSARAEPPVLHEYVPDVDPDEAAVAIGAEVQARDVQADGESMTSMPDAQSSGPAFIATPGDGAFAEEPGRRSPSFRPDRETSLEGTLDYYATFSPAIAPFKRVTSLDRIVLARDGRTPVLVVGDTKRRVLSVEGEAAAPPDGRVRDRFGGRAWVDFSGGLAVPLPSVSPESRILTLATEPPIALRIERDGADNHFAVAASAPPAGVIEVTWLTDAPRAYFGSEIPSVPVAALAAEVPPVPPSVRTRALAFAHELGVGPDGDLQTVLHALAAHFRAFEESDAPPHDTGDAYLDLARAQKGICRHRAYAFVVTAQALGVPARFVQNEAHAWVEVKLPTSGWLRIDLGGAAHGLSAHGASDRAMYQPAHPDTLPRPLVYEQSYSQLQGDVRGLWRPDPNELFGRWLDPAPAVRGAGTNGTGPGLASAATGSPEGASDLAGATTGTAGTAPGFAGVPAGAAGGASGLAGTPVQQGGAAPAFGGAPPRPPDTRRPLRVSVAQENITVMRGRKLMVSGRVAEPGAAGVAGLRIEVSLAAQGRRDRLLLGVTQSRVGGSFHAALAVPPDLAVGDYRLVVLTPGSAAYLPARAE